MQKQKFFNAAINEADESYCDQTHGAVIVSGGQVIAGGHNVKEVARSSHIRKHCSLDAGRTQHAEYAALCTLLRTQRQWFEKGPLSTQSGPICC